MRDARVGDVPREEHAIAARLVEHATGDIDAGGVLDEDSAAPMDRPVATAWHLILLQVGSSRLGEGEAGEGDIARAVDRDDGVQQRRNHFRLTHVRSLSIRGVRPEVELRRRLVVVPLGRRVEQRQVGLDVVCNSDAQG